MVTWKLALAVIIIAILLILTGMWFGYRYVRQQEDISPEARTFSLPVIAGHIRPSWDANVGRGLIPSPTSISWDGSRTSLVGTGQTAHINGVSGIYVRPISKKEI